MTAKGQMEVIDESQKDCQSEVWEMFKNLSSWKDESQNKLTKIINSYDNTIKKGISVLVEEVSDLKTQLSVTVKERNALMETVKNLNEEVRQLGKLFIAHPSSEPEGDNEDTQESPNEMIDTPEVMWEQNKYHERYQEQVNETSDEFTEENLSYIEDEEINEVEDEPTYQDNRQPEENHKRKGFKKTGVSQAASEVSIKPRFEEIKPIKTSQEHNQENKTFKCHVCPYETYKKTLLKMHLTTVHIKGKKKDYKIGDRKFKCEQCPSTFINSTILRRHIKGVHEKIKDHICKCGYVTSRKDHLYKHKLSVHKEYEMMSEILIRVR